MNEQERQMQYYQFPKFLLELQLSQNASIIYMLLYDRARISRKNNWTDECGRVYVVFPIEELSQKTGKCKSSVKKALKELDDAGLLIRKFGGFSKPRHMHVMIPDKVEISGKAQLQTDIKKADIELDVYKRQVLKHLREIQERNKQQPPQRQYKKSIDRDSR